MSGIIDIIIFIFVLGVIIFVHEMGHLIYAKKYNVYCSEFSLGMGPILFSKQYGETKYSLRAIPIGGFVSMAGENEAAEDVEEGRRLFDVSKPRQAMIMFGGAMYNFIFGLLFILLINSIIGVPSEEPIIGVVSENSVVDLAGVTEGSEIVSVNGKEYSTSSDYKMAIIEAKESGSISVVFDNGEDIITVEDDNVDSSYVLGFSYGVTHNIFKIVKSTIIDFFGMLSALFVAIVGLVANFSEVSGDIAGPIGIYGIVGEAREAGIVSVMYLTALLSINIGLFNLLPIPGLDGSKIIIAVGEHIIGKDMPKKLYYALSFAGLTFLLLLMLIVTISDIANLF